MSFIFKDTVHFSRNKFNTIPGIFPIKTFNLFFEIYG